jgi:Mrp family chromosome partitioning ATPase
MTQLARIQADSELLRLYRKVDALVPVPNKVIQIIGVDTGEGSAHMAREFSWLVASNENQRVLLVDANPSEGAERAFLRLPHNISPAGWQEIAELPAKGIHRYEQTNLYVNPFSVNGFSRERLEAFIEKSRAHFGLIVIDCGAVMDSQADLIISPNIDGTLLVIEADRTPMELAEAVVEKVRSLNGNLLGVVFNNYRNHIPGVIEDLLYGRSPLNK